jgi:hypothetical protein
LQGVPIPENPGADESEFLCAETSLKVLEISQETLGGEIATVLTCVVTQDLAGPSTAATHLGRECGASAPHGGSSSHEIGEPGEVLEPSSCVSKGAMDGEESVVLESDAESDHVPHPKVASHLESPALEASFKRPAARAKRIPPREVSLTKHSEISDEQEPESVSTWQRTEAWLKEHSQKYQSACPRTQWGRKSLARFLCTCSGHSDKAYKKPACPVRWHGQAEKCEGTGVKFTIQEFNQHAAGRPANPDKKLRSSRQHFDESYKCVLSDVPVSKAMSEKQLREEAIALCRDKKMATQAGRTPFDCRGRAGWKAVRDHGLLKVALECTSCDPSKCTWEGAAIYDPRNPDNKRFIVKCNGSDTHDASGQKKKWGTLTPASRATLEESKAKTSFGRLISLGSSNDVLDPRQESARRRNKRHREVCKERNTLQNCPSQREKELDRLQEYSADDIKEALLLSGVKWFADLPMDEAVKAALEYDVASESDPEDQAEGCKVLPQDRLVVLAFKTFRLKSGKKGCTVLLSTPELLRNPQRLANQKYLKIAIDATFKDLFGDWKLLPLGFLSKHLAATTLEEGLQATSWATHCTPVIYGVSNTEAHQSYDMLLECFNCVPLATLGKFNPSEQDCPRVDHESVGQYEDAFFGPHGADEPQTPSDHDEEEKETDGEVGLGRPELGAADKSVRADAIAAASHVRQVHSDWAQAIEKARKKQCKHSTKQGDFRHMLTEVKKNIPGRFKGSNAKHKQKLLKNTIALLMRTRTFCTTLAEFHLIWSMFFQKLGSEGELDAVEYLRGTYFFYLPEESAKTQYSCTNVVFGEKGVLCAAWWGAYCRQQPGSASGTQSLEACHLHGFRDGLVDEKGDQVDHLPPVQFFKAMGRILRLQGQLLRKRTTRFPDYPTGKDPTSANSECLKNIGRSTALELLKQKDVISRVVLTDGVAFVMPRTLLTWVWDAPPEDDSDDASDPKCSGDWKPKAIAALRVAPDLAQDLGTMAVTTDCQALLTTFHRRSIVFWDAAGAQSLDVDKWMELRYEKVVVLTGAIATKHWYADATDLYLCPCTYFAVSGRCEHEQCIHSYLETGGLDMETLGQRSRRGRKPTSSVTCPRGLSSAAVLGRREAAAEAEAEAVQRKRVATGRAPQPPAKSLRISPGSAVASLSDAEAIHTMVRRTSTASGSAGSAGVRGGAAEPTPSAPIACVGPVTRVKGPHLYGTDFDLIKRAVLPNQTPADVRIYWNAAGQESQM